MQADQSQSQSRGKFSKFVKTPLMVVFILALQNCGNPLAVFKHQQLQQQLTSGTKYNPLPNIMTILPSRDTLVSCQSKVKTTL